MSKNNDTNPLNFLFGIALGAVGALMYAPKSGEETRKDIKNFAQQKADEAKQTLEDRRDQLQDELANIEKELAKQAEKASKKADDVKKSLE